MFKGPFRELQLTVELGDPLVFTFAAPLSITTLMVTRSDDEIVWEIIASEFQPVETEGGSFQTWPIDQAPPEIIKLLEEIGERAEHEMADVGPRKAPCSSVIYGHVPSGYREEQAAQQLTPGKYHVIAFGEQGTARMSFEISAAPPNSR